MEKSSALRNRKFKDLKPSPGLKIFFEHFWPKKISSNFLTRRNFSTIFCNSWQSTNSHSILCFWIWRNLLLFIESCWISWEYFKQYSDNCPHCTLVSSICLKIIQENRLQELSKTCRIWQMKTEKRKRGAKALKGDERTLQQIEEEGRCNIRRMRMRRVQRCDEQAIKSHIISGNHNSASN